MYSIVVYGVVWCGMYGTVWLTGRSWIVWFKFWNEVMKWWMDEWVDIYNTICYSWLDQFDWFGIVQEQTMKLAIVAKIEEEELL